jgi:hypothetical protein
VVRQDGAAAIGFGIREKSRALRAAPGRLIFLRQDWERRTLKSAVAEGEALGKELRPFLVDQLCLFGRFVCLLAGQGLGVGNTARNHLVAIFDDFPISLAIVRHDP